MRDVIHLFATSPLLDLGVAVAVLLVCGLISRSPALRLSFLLACLTVAAFGLFLLIGQGAVSIGGR